MLDFAGSSFLAHSFVCDGDIHDITDQSQIMCGNQTMIPTKADFQINY